METAQIILFFSLGVTALALAASLYLLVQAITDSYVLKKSGKNGALKILGRTAIIQEALRFLKLSLLGSLLVIALVLDGGEWLTVRRILVVCTISLIAAGSLYGGHARRRLIKLVDEEIETRTRFVKATELLEDDAEGPATSYRIEEIPDPEVQ